MLRRDPILRIILDDLDDVPQTVTSRHGQTAPISPTAANSLRDRLETITTMHADGTLSDAQLLAALPHLIRSCEDTSVLHHMLQPEQMETIRRRALDHIAGAITDEDIAALNAIQPL